MERFVKGDIVVTPFPFSDLTSSTKRPALIVASLKGEDIILCQITSKEHEDDPYQIILDKEDLSEGNLKIKSFIKPSILFTIRKSIIAYKLGRIKKDKVKEVENKLLNLITK
jgi:mRNA interferase MazF